MTLRIIGILLAISLSGCATSGSLPKVSSPELAQLRRIAMTPVGVPQVPRVQILNSASDWFWVPGAMAGGIYSGAAGNEIGKLLKDAGFDYGSEATTLFEQSIANSGLSIARVDPSSLSENRKWPLSECPRESTGDACVDVRLTYFGYVAAFASSDYVPTAHISARVIRARDAELLFERNIHYNPINPGKAADIFASGEFRFHDLDAMRADPQGVVAGLRAALSAVASELGTQLQSAMKARE
jgi:hypothetical protein